MPLQNAAVARLNGHTSDHAAEISIARDLEELERFRARYLCEGCSRKVDTPRYLHGWIRVKNYCEQCFDEVEALELAARTEVEPAPTWRQLLAWFMPEAVVAFASLALVLFVLFVVLPLALP